MRFLFLIVFVFLSSCATLEKDKTVGWSDQKLYEEAKASMNSGTLITAKKLYQKILARYPFGKYAQQTGLDLIVLNYRDKEYDKAIAAADRFIQLYPNHKSVDYARYMKGVVNYSRDVNIIEKLVPTNIAQSDQSRLYKSFADFKTLVEISPNGEYTEDAKKRMTFLRNVIAEHEIHVAEYYLRRKAYLAAVNRGKFVLENHSKTPSVALALAVLTRGYQELGLQKLSADSKRVLEKNFADEIKTNGRLKYILTGNIHKKRGFFSKIRQTLAN